MGCLCFRRNKNQNRGPQDSHQPKLDKKKSSSLLRYMECFSECFSLCAGGGGGGDWVGFYGGEESYTRKNLAYKIVCMCGKVTRNKSVKECLVF